MAVRAEGGAPDINVIAANLTKAFADFKQSHQTEIAELREAVDTHSVMMAAHQMSGAGAGSAARDEQQPIYAARGLRAAQISAHYNQRAKAAGEDTSINMADFLRGVAGMKCSDAVKASLSVGTDSAGGYAVPNVVMPKILDALVDQSALLTAGAGILPVTDGAKSVTVAGIDTLPTPAWRNELGAVAESEPTFRGVVATPRSLTCIVRISRELLADADDVSRAVTQAISQAFALEFDRAGLVGNGVAPQPLGLYGMEAVNKIEQIGAKFAYGDMLAAYQTQLERKAPAPTAAIMAPRTLVGLAGLVDTTGQPLSAPPLLSNVRQLATNGVPTNLGDGNAKSLVFVGNFSTVQYALRETLNIGLLREAYAKTGEIGFLCHARVDVIANYPQAITVIEAVAS
ncbi:phage major capsid protein [Burkholderia sp. Ac-20379]|uniref:phage major capsid protein n=1 Tax=Burkholderia sp. Ac-20379 TaxID=2703900 RepID=UPI0019819A42|nr:phage major capsid protein [Burkholderia sp. Ac-20379]MBN3723766.1 phage major capsid protein [Burkholderia sp. Ac-20379]